MTGRRLTIGHAPRALAAHLEAPAGPLRAGAVVCHPHPEYGGDMENAVVVAVARALAADGVAALRFDFGAFSGGSAEVSDARVALDALAAELPPATPLALAGYSFGAWVALRAAAEGAPVRGVVAIGPPLAFLDWSFLDDLTVPVAVVAGARDQFCDARRLAAHAGRLAAVDTVAGADHFLAGREEVAAALATRRLREFVA